MGSLTRRPSFVTSLLFLLSCTGAATVVACSSSDASSSETNGDPDASNNDVHISTLDHYGLSTGTATEVARTEKPTSIAAIAMVDGVSKTIAATANPDGSFTIVGVPNAPYVLDVRFAGTLAGDPPFVTQYPMDGARNVRLGADLWARAGAVAMASTSTTKLALSVETPATFASGDQFSWIGLKSYFFREYYYYDAAGEPVEHEANIPAEAAPSSSGWTIDGDALDSPYGSNASGLPDAAKGDDLKLIQSRRDMMTTDKDRFDPWKGGVRSTAVASLDVSNATFTNETTNTVTGTLVAPTKQSVTVDFKGSTFATQRETAGYPIGMTSAAVITLSQEAGPGPALLDSAAPVSWSLSAWSKDKPVDLTCFPEELGTECDPAVCTIGCDKAVSGSTDPGDLAYTFDAPRLYTTGMRDIYDVSYAYYYAWVMPGHDDVTATISAFTTMRAPLSGTTISIERDLSEVQKPQFDGVVLSWDKASSVSSTPTVSFTAPATGTPEYYMVSVVELAPDFGTTAEQPRYSRNVALFNTRATSLKMPDGILRSGHYYYLLITAARDGRDFTTPYLTKGERSARTAVATAPFIVQ